MEERILAAVEDYRRTNSVEQTARNLRLSSGTVRKMLLTAGVWSNKTSNDIAILRREHPEYSNAQIAENMKISQKAVQLYSPYEGFSGMALNFDRTEQGDDEVMDSGDCGDKANWRLTRGGVLTVSGTGAMWDYNGCSNGIMLSPRPKWWARMDGIRVKQIRVEEGITVIGQYAFSNLTELTAADLPDTVAEIKGGAFCGENHLRRFVIPEKVRYIAWDTFYLNILLEEIHIPAGVYKIQTYAFHACMSLRKMFFYGDAPRTANSVFDMCPEGGITVCHRENAKGFGEIWNGYRTAVF